MKTTWRKIANRLRGFGFEIPIVGGGVSAEWEPPALWETIAQEVITFLEDKRVLYNDFELETPDFCVQSVINIREHLTDQLQRMENKPGLPAHLRYMRG